MINAAVKTEVIRLEDIWVYYNGVPALEGIDLVVEQNDFLGIIGPNGGGKTTLLRVILGLIKPDRGRVFISGDSVEKMRGKIGYVAQQNNFDRDFPVNVLDVVLMGRYGGKSLFRNYGRVDKLAAENALNMVKMLESRNRCIGELSGGQQQRVFIARALVAEPEVLLLDEPTASVDSNMQTEFYEILNDLKKRMAIVMVSHDISAISIYVDKIACLNGHLYYHGTKEIGADILEAAYKCPVQMIAHGVVPHRVLKEHD